ncbi:hypothetical protein FQZ97_1234070 [compost metagenome]
MPNQIRSMPAVCTVGINTPMVSTIMEMPSRKQPSRMKNSASAISNSPGDRPSEPTHSARWRGSPM